MGEFSSPTREEPPEKGRPRMDRSTKFVAIDGGDGGLHQSSIGLVSL